MLATQFIRNLAFRRLQKLWTILSSPIFSVKESPSLGLSANTLLEGIILGQSERNKREVRQGRVNSKYKRMHSFADTPSQRDTANHLAMQDASKQSIHNKVMSQNSPWKGGMERRFTCWLTSVSCFP